MTLPVMEPGQRRGTWERWARAIDEGPFSTLAFGERMAFDNPELMALLGACAAWTSRVRLATTVIVAPLHDPVWLAKHLATVDMLCDGRLSVGLGIDGRLEDYRAVGADATGRTQAELARRVALMRRVWAGERVLPDLLLPVGPSPVQLGGPPLLAGAQGPKSIRASAEWADGITGFSFGPNLADIDQTLRLARSAWQQAGRPAPRLVIAFWYDLGPGAREQITSHLRGYLNWLDPRDVEAMLPDTGFAGSAPELRAFLRRISDLGADEVLLIPTSADPSEIARAADLIG
ncbi:MAG: LLM class flavin-dependent oxidoreductase [Myxococcales bacterium]|nr:MAG: LLM class flavin-dependent oxidoreductase [Myxococcales bacterium]